MSEKESFCLACAAKITPKNSRQGVNCHSCEIKDITIRSELAIGEQINIMYIAAMIKRMKREKSQNLKSIAEIEEFMTKGIVQMKLTPEQIAVIKLTMSAILKNVELSTMIHSGLNTNIESAAKNTNSEDRDKEQSQKDIRP